MNKETNEDDYSKFIQLIEENVSKPFKEEYSYVERFSTYQVLRCNYPGFFPVSCEIEPFISQDKQINHFKFYISEDILVGHLRQFLKKLLMEKYPQKVSKKDVLLIIVGEDVVIKLDVPIRDVYQKKKELDGWLYMKLAFEN